MASTTKKVIQTDILCVGAGVASLSTALALLRALEAQAAADGHTRLVCETRRVNDVAVAFYLRAGWTVCESYGKYVGRPETVCFEKRLK